MNLSRKLTDLFLASRVIIVLTVLIRIFLREHHVGREKYIVNIGEEGSIGLGRLDYCFNPSTKTFLFDSGLSDKKKILDIGCGSGVMTCWIASQVSSDATIIAIENDINQLNVAKRNAENLRIDNIQFELCSAYDIDSLEQEFDFIYCRFVLHHLQEPMQVISTIYECLASGGVYASEEGIVNFAFSYPFSPAWGDETLRVPPIWEDPPKNQRDGNIGTKMFTKMQMAGFKINSIKIIHPVLTTPEEKKLLLLGRDELKNHFLEQGHTEQEWIALGKETENIVDNNQQIIGFYASCQVAGTK